jgi:tRNA(Arg) A34 adenosine deaminase TadA
MNSKQQQFMLEAISLAKIALAKDEVPIGAIIIDSRNNQIIASGYNQVEHACDATLHAEIIAIKTACKKLQTSRLEFCDIFVTLEPCAMCASAISHARIRRLYFAAYDPKGGAVENGVRFFTNKTCHHVPEIYGGILEQESAKLLRSFFQTKR